MARRTRLVKLKKLVLVIAQSILHSLHQSQHLFFFKSTSDDLDTNGQAVHFIGVVVLVGTTSNAVQLVNVKVLGELILGLVNMSDRDDTSRVIKKVEHECVAAAAASIIHAVVGNSGRGVRGCNDEINLLLIPVLKEAALVELTLGNQSPVLGGSLGVPVDKQIGPDGITAHILDPEVVHVLDRTGELGVEAHLSGTAVLPLTTAHERCSSVEAISIQQLRSNLKGLKGGRGVKFDNLVASATQSGLGHLQSSLTSRAGVNNVVCTEDSNAELLLFQVCLGHVVSPRDGVDGVVVGPRLHLDNGACEVCEIVEGASHRAVDGGNTILARHTRAHAELHPTASRALERVAAREMGGAADTASDITADTDSATHGKEGTFTTSRSTRSVLGIVRVGGTTPEVVLGLKAEQGNGDVGLDIGDSASFLEHAGSDTVLSLGLVDKLAVADSAVIASDVNGVLQADGNAGKRTLEVDGAISKPLFGIGEKNLCNTVGLLMGLEGNLAVRLEKLGSLGGVSLDFFDEVFNGLVENLAVDNAEGTVVGCQ